MSQPIRLSSEQHALLDQCKAHESRFIADTNLYGSKKALEDARLLIDQAVETSLPTSGYSGLQIAVSAHENDKELPEHTRQYKDLP